VEYYAAIKRNEILGHAQIRADGQWNPVGLRDRKMGKLVFNGNRVSFWGGDGADGFAPTSRDFLWGWDSLCTRLCCGPVGPGVAALVSTMDGRRVPLRF
jgi:hypothetical protein